MDRKIIYHKWQCLKCKLLISEDFEECPNCSFEKIEKRRKMRHAGMRFYDKHHERMLEKNRKYRSENREKFRNYFRKWFEKNRIEHAKKQLIKYHKNPGKILEQQHNYYLRNREKILEKLHQRRSKMSKQAVSLICRK
jgi:hypothetical protein